MRANRKPGHAVNGDTAVVTHSCERLGDPDALVTRGGGIFQPFREAKTAEKPDNVTQRPADTGEGRSFSGVPAKWLRLVPVNSVFPMKAFQNPRKSSQITAGTHTADSGWPAGSASSPGNRG
jgi:hypothetical protein